MASIKEVRLSLTSLLDRHNKKRRPRLSAFCIFRHRVGTAKFRYYTRRSVHGCRRGGMMRPYFVLFLLLLIVCQNTRGPLAPRPPRPDDPGLSIPEQQSLGRDRI